jgi:mono/diheme cytochrome c family protein
MLRLAASVLLFLSLTACSDPITEPLTGQCDDLTVAEQQYFDDVMLPEFFDVHCVLCHDSALPEGQATGTRRGAPRSFNYNTHEGAAASPEATWSRIADRTMPPMGREVNDAEVAMVTEWLSCLIAKDEAEGDDDDSSL